MIADALGFDKPRHWYTVKDPETETDVLRAMTSDTEIDGGPTAEAQTPPEGEPPQESQEDAANGGLPKAVTFEHGFFNAVDSAYFRTLEDTNEPVLIMILEGQGEVSLKIPGVKKELNLEPGDPDARMLDLVVESLKYVREVRIGDPVPSEMTSGRASWNITDEHRAIAHNRVTMQLVSWMSGEEMLITDPLKLAQVVSDPATKEKISNAFNEAAKALGIGEERREDVIALIANLAEELAYIEALRSKFHEIQLIYRKIFELDQKYKADQSVRDDILAIRRLFKIAVDGFKDSFEQLDAQTGEILSALTNIAPVTKFIRKNRDDLRRRLWAWDPVIHRWSDIPAQRSTKAERALGDLYHFLAQRFLPRNEWELYSKALEKTKKRATEVIW